MLGAQHLLDQMGHAGYKEVIADPGSGVIRKYDLVMTKGTQTQYREFKTGFVRFATSGVESELRKGADWGAPGHTVIWSVQASGAAGIGVDEEVLDALEKGGILFEIHWPDEGF